MIGRVIATYGLIASVLAIVGGFIGANVVGVMLRWHPLLGGAWFESGGVDFYAPWSLLRWWARWGDAVPELRVGWGIVAFCVVAGTFAVIGGQLKRKVSGAPKCIDENDGWGTEADLRAAGLVGGRGFGALGGLILGQQANQKLVTYDGREHLIVSGTTGSGKTASEVVPCGMSWRGSIVVSDPKRELFAIMGGYRGKLGPSFFFDPTHPDSACFNPLETEVRWGTHFEQGDVEDLVSVLNKSRGLPQKTDASMYYAKTACKLLSAVVLCIHEGKLAVGMSFGDILRKLAVFHTSVLPKMLSSKNEYVRLQGMLFGDWDSKKQGEILSTVEEILHVFSDDMVHEKTCSSDFAMADIFASDEPMSLFIQIRKSEAERLGPLVSLMESLLVHCSLFDERRLRDGRLKQQEVLLICEEFPAQGEKTIISENLLVLRSYKVTVMIVTQSIKALERVYGRTSTIFGMCKAAVMYASLDADEQEVIARNCGTKQVLERTVRRDRKLGSHASESSKVVTKRVIDAAGVRALPDDKQVLLMLGQQKAYLLNKPLWFKHPMFRELGVDTHGTVDVVCDQSPWILAKHQARFGQI